MSALLGLNGRSQRQVSEAKRPRLVTISRGTNGDSMTHGHESTDSLLVTYKSFTTSKFHQRSILVHLSVL